MASKPRLSYDSDRGEDFITNCFVCGAGLPCIFLMKETLAQINWNYYRGDTFNYWNGAKLPDNHELDAPFQKALKRIYHSYNLIEEITTHYVNSLIGKPFHWDVSGSGADTAKKILESWWSWQRRCSVKQKLSQGKPIAEAIAQMLVRDNGNGDGSGFLRLFAPEKYRHYSNSEEPWKQYIIMCALPGSVVTTEDDDNVTVKIEHFHNSDRWIYTLLDNGFCQTVKNDEVVSLIDLDGKLPIFELNGKCIIGQDTREIQNSINHVLTLKDMNLKYAGFLERVLLNTAPPGHYEEKDGRRVFIPDNKPFEFGFDKIVSLQGLELGGQDSLTRTNPQIVYREPVSIENFEQSIRLDIETLYMSVGLGHLLATGDGSVSGKSRLAAQKDYAVRLEGYSEIIESVIEDIFLSLLKLVDPELEVDVTVQLDLSHDLLKETVEIVTMMNDPGFISLETARKRLAIPNYEEEAEKIAAEREAEIEMGAKEDDFVGQFSKSE